MNVYDRDIHIRAVKIKNDFHISEKNYESILSLVNKKRSEFIAKKQDYLISMEKYQNILNESISKTLSNNNNEIFKCYESILSENKLLIIV